MNDIPLHVFRFHVSFSQQSLAEATFAVIGALALTFIRRGRRLADSVDDADKYWT